MKRQHMTIAALGLAFSLTTNGANAVEARKVAAKPKTTKAKIVSKKVRKAASKAVNSGPRFVDGVAILNYDGGGSIALSGGTSSVRTINKGGVRTTTTTKLEKSESSTRSADAPRGDAPRRAAREKPKRPTPPQFTTTATDGSRISLSQYRGKVVLLDFWATWCPPCRVEVPQLVRIYNKYHRQGLEIVGASLDSDADKLESFTKANDMNWRQIFGGKNWDSDLAQLYGIRSIPSNVLIARDGTAVAVDVHGAQLQAAIEYALAER